MKKTDAGWIGFHAFVDSVFLEYTLPHCFVALKASENKSHFIVYLCLTFIPIHAIIFGIMHLTSCCNMINMIIVQYKYEPLGFLVEPRRSKIAIASLKVLMYSLMPLIPRELFC